MIDLGVQKAYLIDQDLRGESRCELYQRLQPALDHYRIKGLDAGRYHWLDYDHWWRRGRSCCWLRIGKACNSASTWSPGLAFRVF